MKILFVTPRFPFPPLKGDQVVQYHRLRVLSERHEISLLSMYETDAELEGMEHLRAFSKDIHVVKLPRLQSLLNVALRGPFSGLPLQALYYQSPVFKNELSRLLARTSYDVVHAFMLRLAPYMSAIAKPKVLELIDSMQLNLERRIEKESIPWRWVFREELRRVAPFEKSVGASFDELVVVSEKDRLLISGSNVSVVPNGVDSDLFSPNDKPKHEVPTIIFSGNMGYAPNISAVKWFADKCLLRIQREIPCARLVVAGRNPPRAIRALATRDGVTVTGLIDSMPDALNTAHVAVAPMVSGSGIQNKILEAMACGLPVVTTSLGLGAIAAGRNEEVVVADDEENFSEKVIMLLRNPLISRSIGEKARDFVIRNHSWAAAGADIERIYSKIIKQ